MPEVPGLGPGDRLPEHAFEVPDLPLKLTKTPRILLRAEAADFLPFLVEHLLQFRALHDWEAFSMKCPQCPHENPPQAKFCLECGGRQTLTCAKCRAELPRSAKFCLECGEPVGPQIQTRSPKSYTPKHLAEKILTSKAAFEGERRQGRARR